MGKSIIAKILKFSNLRRGGGELARTKIEFRVTRRDIRGLSYMV